MEKEKIVVICPGRGSYNSDELGYLYKYHSRFLKNIVRRFDEIRKGNNQIPIAELDSAEKFKPSLHTKGENASPLIYACAYADFLSINPDKYDILAITGNSMGWYIALACAGVLSSGNAFTVINTMGSMMKDGNIGGQVIYPIIDDSWRLNKSRLHHIRTVADKINYLKSGVVYDSIYLGGNIVLGADKNGLKELLRKLDKVKIGRVEYPFQLINHAAFHTPLMNDTSQLAFSGLNRNLFKKARIPLIDGKGNIWKPYSTEIEKIYDYTFAHQVYTAYDFTKSITTALKEFCPDRLVLLGAGGSLGSSIAQILIQNKWKGIQNKEDFVKQQKSNYPFLVSMGRQNERERIL